MKATPERLNRCLGALGYAHDPRALYDELVAAYCQSHRAYHTLQHLEECFALLDKHQGLADFPDEIEAALWFHDAVYKPLSKGNEEASARWAQDALTAGGVSPRVAARIAAHVRATSGHLPTGDSDTDLLTDIDLAILGAPAARFAQYEQQIRREFRWVPGLLFATKRREVLRGFHSARPLYKHPALRHALEAQAKANLKAAIQG